MRTKVLFALSLVGTLLLQYAFAIPSKASISLNFELSANDSSSTSGYQFFLNGDGSVTQPNSASLGVWLGPLASRSQSKNWVSFSGTSAPYTVVGTDSRTNTEYTYQTSVNYSGDSRKESGERGFSSFSFSRTLNHTYLSRSGVVYLRSSGNCTGGNSGSYCSVFGPEVWTNAFDASAGQALSFDYAASASDNYEVYAFLVKVSETTPGNYDYGGGKFGETTNPLTTHSLILHERGKSTSWKTGSGTVPETGKYRFRFVDGAYDQTGGYALGTDFYIDPASISVAESQLITFESLGDRLLSDGSFVVESMPTSSSGLTVSVTSGSTGVCTISGSTVTLISNGNCILNANQAGGTNAGVTYAAAGTVIRTFQVRASATKPSNTGAAPTVSGSRSVGSTLTATDGSWSDGGSPITSTNYQWQVSNDGSSWTNITGANASTYVVAPEDVGKRFRISVSKTNSIGSESLNSAATAVIATPILSDLVTSDGALDPTFSSTTTSYQLSVVNTIDEIVLTPTLTSGSITINGANVASGAASSPIILNTGTNSISIVTDDGSVSMQYSLVVTRAAAPAPAPAPAPAAVPVLTPSATPTTTPAPTRTPRPTRTIAPTIAPTPTQQPLFPQLIPTPTPTPTQTPLAGAPTRPVELVRKTIEEVVEILRPRIINLNTLINPTNNPDPVASANASSAVNPLPTASALALVTVPEEQKRVGDIPSSVLRDGVPQESRVIVVQETKSQVVTPDGGLLSVEAKADEEPVPVDTRGRVQMVRENFVEAEGQGLAAGTEFAVYLFSQPILLGVGQTDLAGRFFASFPVEDDLPLGDHTLQVVGVTPTGEQRTVAMPVVVVDNKETALSQALPQSILVDQNPVQAWYESINYLLTLLLVLILVSLWVLFGSWRKGRDKV